MAAIAGFIMSLFGINTPPVPNIDPVTTYLKFPSNIMQIKMQATMDDIRAFTSSRGDNWNYVEHDPSSKDYQKAPVIEMCQAAKNILHHVIRLNPKGPFSYAPPTIITKGRRKLDSTKRYKSHLEHIQIAHTTMKKSSESGLGLGFGTSSCGKGRPPHVLGGQSRGRSSGWSSGLSSVSIWGGIGFLRRFYEILHGCVHWEGFAPRQCWIDLHDHLIVTTNRGVNGSRQVRYSLYQTRTLIVKHGPRPRPFGYKIYRPRPDPPGSRVGLGIPVPDCSMILRIYSESEHMQDTIVIGHFADREHFITVIFSLKFTFFL
ncbi:hypothetical protein M9H77_27915 [Catharanthus roseus]|uniref:Uncharacterized protein n=1 Tax=Catharanthus roseus TaxID=4058 RepID=A0ACC0AFA9_CATRO|nr:hypothetical protein M9H77_27915 [Catharanthus roseus]